ncbi:plasma membrane ascorbate-dependent reductase CYBRD1 isoform X2 [Culicoides brevitarsis]|uniref:plasma membrane ascorbate-dependent reductase CYBRD1 isoform X2 n=1 Tax=Culicoides brevitarsis TaxID=469753 RepID=UPI00307B95D6
MSVSEAQTPQTQQPVAVPVSTAQRSNMEEIGSTRNLVNFRLLYIISQLIGVVIIVLMISWIGIHLNGLAWTATPSVQFNWHPLLMTIGMIFLYGNSILVYRGFRHARKRPLKLTHAALHAAAFLFTVIALVAVFDSHNLANPPIPNMYSLHSWVGLSAVLIFSMQYVVGFVTFLFPQLKDVMREKIMPFHVIFGILGFVMAICAALLGLSEKAFFHIKNISELPSEGLLVNSIGMCMIFYGAIVVFLVTERQFKREPLPEDTMLLTGGNSD